MVLLQYDLAPIILAVLLITALIGMSLWDHAAVFACGDLGSNARHRHLADHAPASDRLMKQPCSCHSNRDLKPKDGEITLNCSALQRNPSELAVWSRSMIVIMQELSADIDVPLWMLPTDVLMHLQRCPPMHLRTTNPGRG